jgi:hypothetical protein
MSKAFSFQGSLSYPPDAGQPSVLRALSQSGSFTSKVEQELVLTGAGTEVVDFGSVANAKLFMVKVRSDSVVPVGLVFNAGSEQLEVSPGGFAVIGSPAPSAGITDLSIVHTDDANVDVYILE